MRISSALLVLGLMFIPALAQTTTNVDLIWEASTYTHDEYQGKALAGPESEVQVNALVFGSSPSGNPWNNKELFFSWNKNREPLREASGQGRNILRFISQSSGSDQIGVVVSDKTGQLLAQGTVNIPIVKPRVLFYEEDILLGKVYEKSLTTSHNLVKPETTLVAEPMFFGLPLTNLSYEWSLNKTKVAPDSQRPSALTLIWPKEGGRGSNPLSVLIKHGANALQAASNQINITFDIPNTSYDDDL